jgi:TatD family-associated radical SAM protein
MQKKKKQSIVYWIDNKLYLNITNKCSNRCSFCIKNFKQGLDGFKLELSEEPTRVHVIDSIREVINTKNWSEIVFCGFGEPTEKLDLLLEITKWIKRHYGKPIKFRVNTNGQGNLINPNRDVIKELKKAGIDKVSVSLNSSNEKTYSIICHPKFKNAYNAILEFVKKAKKELEVEVTAVNIVEADIKKVEKIAKKLGVKFRKRVYSPYFS